MEPNPIPTPYSKRWCPFRESQCAGDSCEFKICRTLATAARFLVSHTYSDVKLERVGGVINVARTIRERGNMGD